VAWGAVRNDPRPLPAAFHASLVGVDGGGRAGPVRPPRPQGRRGSPGFDCDPLRLRNPDHSRHPHRAVGDRDLACRSSPGDGSSARRRHGLGRARAWHRPPKINPTEQRPMSVISVYAVFANAEEAERIGRTVVEERLAACVNILGPIRSIYRWEGAVQTANEVTAIFKTPDRHGDALIELIAALHSYDVPCVVAWPIDKIIRSYADWVEDNVR